MANNSVMRLLRDKRALLERLQREVEILEQAALILDDAEPESGRGPGRPRGFSAPQPNSAVGRAIAILVMEGAPIHVDCLAEQVGAKKSSLVSSLSKLASAGRLVRRTGKGMFEAIGAEEAEQPGADQPEVVH